VADIHSLISSRVRVKLLMLLTLFPDTGMNINELSRKTGYAPRGVEKELKNLLSGGILKRDIVGNQHRYQLDPRCPILQEIKSIMNKTVGVAELVKQAITPAEREIDVAFIYGSFASGDYSNDSDIDLFVVGRVSGLELAGLLGPVQNEVGRAINPVLFSPEEFKERRSRDDHFLSRVLDGPIVMLMGVIDES
jgi:predicted nucleotidyltransferase